MAYTKQTWENAPSTNSPLNANRLNHMEDGIYNASLVANSHNESDTNAYSCDYINNNYQMNGTILWTNPNPTSSFGSQTITLSSSDYDVLEWYIGASTNRAYIFTEKSIKGSGVSTTFIVEINQDVNQYTGFIQRNIKYATDTTYNVANCLSRRNTTQSTPTVDNNYMIPLYVVGYKTGLFS